VGLELETVAVRY